MAVPRLAIDCNDATTTQVGAGGLTPEELAAAYVGGNAAIAAVSAARAAGGLAWWALPGDASIREPAQAMGASLASQFDELVVLGIGGSSLGPRAVISALSPLHNLRAKGQRAGARVFFPDNSDPDGFAALLDVLDLSKTGFVIASKSGGTAETLAQLLVLRDRLGGGSRERIVAITDPTKGALRRIADQEGWRTLPVPPPVGGRFSELTAVGLVPIAAAGLAAIAVCRGADAMRVRCEAKDVRENPAALLATLLHTFDTRKGRRIHVLFPYADALRDVGDWWVQLWAESLGKKREVGPTPIRAVGATDQHSLLQLLIEGPDDKAVVFVGVERPGRALAIPPYWSEHEELGYLGGKTMAQLLDAERRGTTAALAESSRPSLTITLPAVDAEQIGAFLFLWEAATAFAGALYGVDAFDQPGVELSKKITQGLLGRRGSEAHATRIAARPPRDPKLTCP